MSLIYLSGSDITEGMHQVIAQQTNCCFNIEPKGLSETLSQIYNVNFYASRTTTVRPGTVDIKYIGKNTEGKPRWCIGLNAQRYPGKANSTDDTANSRLRWFQVCLDRIQTFRNLKNIAFPYKIGCGLAGGDWSKYKKLLEEFAIRNQEIQVYIISKDVDIPEAIDDSFESSSSTSIPTWKSMSLETFTKNNNIRNWNFFDVLAENGVIEEMSQYLEKEKKKYTIYPPLHQIYHVFEICSPDQVKVIIIGMDPYINEGQAEGLSFSVPENIPIPPSLVNIYKELSSDLGIDIKNRNGNLRKWCEQGVLLCNASLTVRAGESGSHSKEWHRSGFTSIMMDGISKEVKKGVVILWGGHAKNFGSCFDDKKFKKITSVHPSPLSAHGGFFGSRPFSRTNKMLIDMGLTPIDW